MTDPLSAMFDGVGLISDQAAPERVRGIEVPDNLVVAHQGPPIACPVEWLNRSRIKLIHEILGPSCMGMFMPADEIDKCWVKLNKLFNGAQGARAQHTLWHEIGHAIDHLSEKDELLIVTPHQYSTTHEAILREHAGLIVALREAKDDASFHTNEDWTAYANKPNELWAEAVALAVTRPTALHPTALWAVLYDELRLRNINVLPPLTVLPQEADPVMAPKAVEEPGKPLPTLGWADLKERTDADAFPLTIWTILHQMGGFSLTGVLCAVGCALGELRHLRWRHPKGSYDRECRGKSGWKMTGHVNVTDGPHLHIGSLDYTVGIDFPVNGKTGEGWRMAVTYEPCDTYKVYLWAGTMPIDLGLGDEPTCVLLDERDDVFFDSLDEVIDRMYVAALKKYNDGFIPS